MMENREQGAWSRKDKNLGSPECEKPFSAPGPRSQAPGSLYIVATPIGNLEDITLRALSTLKSRHSRKLLTHFNISKRLTSYFDHNKEFKGNYILDKLADGLNVALISDAGTPCISDPGYQLVRDAVKAGITVVPVPGPSAAIAALSAAGLPTSSFMFEGFLPNRQGKRRERLAALKHEQGVLIFYESPVRLSATLSDMAEVLGDREAVVARELTKIYEEFVRAPLAQLSDRFGAAKVRGEVVILVAPATATEETDAPEVPELLRRYLEGHKFSLKDAVRMVAVETGVARSKVYAEALNLKAELKKV